MRTLLFKTRTNFFPKYLSEDNTLMIYKNSQVQKAVIEETDYQSLLSILSYFRNGNILDLTDKDIQYKRLIKFALMNHLLFEVPKEEGSVSSFIFDYIENAFDDYSAILDQVIMTEWKFVNTPAELEEFFKKHGLLLSKVGKQINQRIVFLGAKQVGFSSIDEGDLCILENSGDYVLFFYKEREDVKKAQQILGKLKDNRIELPINDEILAMHLFIKYSKKLKDQEEVNTITGLSKYGQVEEFHKGDLWAVQENYERNFPAVYEDNNLDYIQAIEGKLMNFQGAEFKINEGKDAYPNQLNIAQYKITINDDFSKTIFDYSYRDAAEYCLSHLLESYLQKEAGENEFWISENSKELFYIRGMANFLSREPKSYHLENLPKELQDKIQYIKTISEGIDDLKILIDYVYEPYVFQIHILDQDNQLLHSGDYHTDLSAEINRGFAFITASEINQVHIKGRKLDKEGLEKMNFPEKGTANQEIYEQMLREFKNLSIEEKAWVFQAEFEPHGLYVGRFQKVGVE